MATDFTTGIVRILDQELRTVGTGFVLTKDGLIATCAHVIDSAEARPGQCVNLIFYATQKKRQPRAKPDASAAATLAVEPIHPYSSQIVRRARVLPEYFRSRYAEDVAILYLEGELPTGVSPLQCVPSHNTYGQTARTFGFPKDKDIEGLYADTRILGLGSENEYPVLQLSSFQLSKGFSGAPIWDEKWCGVIGMASSIIGTEEVKLGPRAIINVPSNSDNRQQETAFATPTETLWLICSDLRPADQCPYRNLKAFTKDDAPYFFGRERVLDELVKKLQHESQFLAVLGPSGCGKSSLVQAGLRPRLEKEAVFGSNHWDIIITRPTDLAFKNIVTSLQQKQQHVGLIIDQFEELFVAYPEEECQEIVTLLTKLLERSPYLHLILTLRNDFYRHFVRFEALEKWLEKGMVNIPSTLQPKEVRDVIQKPAEIVRLGFDEGLVEIIVKDVLEMHPPSDSKESGALTTVLPLLEFALTKLWEKRDTDQNQLTLAAYNTIGGVTGGLKQCADEAYTALTERERELARRIFTQLVYINDKTLQISCLPRLKDELISTIVGEQGMVEQVIQRLITAHLLVANQTGESATIELSHEALISEWPKLRDLLHEARDDILFQQSFSKDVTEWEQRKQSNDLLYRGVQLKEAQAWARHNRPGEQEMAFLQASATRQTLSLMSIIVVVLLLISSAGVAVRFALTQAADPTVVTTELDGVSGSLRYCVDNAPPGSTIRFAQDMRGRTITLTKGDLVFTSGKRLTIVGPGANLLTISGVGAIIHVFKGATLNISDLSFKNSETVNDAFLFNEGTLTISSSIISGNKTTDVTSGLGGGINNSGTLTVTRNTIISNNSITGLGINQGGGINNSGKLTLVNSIVSDNEARGSGDGLGTGGGIENESTGIIDVTSSLISGNKALNDTNDGFGGGVENLGALTVTNSTFSGNLVTGNSIAKGGGISNDGKLTVNHSTFMKNTANSSGTGRFDSSFGGGIENGKSGTLTVTNSTFSSNLASGKQGGAGGGIGNGGQLSVTESTFSNNSASGSFGFGGGIYNLPAGTLMVTSSTFSANTASGKQAVAGGGINNTGKLSVTESTFSNNSTRGSAGGIGGGLFSGTKGSSAIIRFCTIYKNTSDAGGGIWVDPTGSSQMTIGDDIIAANSALSEPDILGPVISGGYNLIENTAGVTGLNANVDRQVTLADLKIETTLGNNGGSTQTLALLQGSKAIDAVPLQACSIIITDPWSHNVTVTTDQRGHPRPDGSEKTCDVGAYESS